MADACTVTPVEHPTPLASTSPAGALPQLLSEDWVAEYLGVDVRTLQRKRKAGEIRWRDVFGKPKYTLEDVQWLLDQRLKAPIESPTRSPTSTSSSGGQDRRCSTSSGGRRGGPSAALQAVANLSQPSGAAGS